MAASANKPHVRGQNVVLKFFQNNKPVYLNAKNWEVEENATEIAEGVNGEDRDRLDKVTNYFSCSVDTYMQDQEILQAYFEALATDDATQLPLRQVLAVQGTERDGVRFAYLMQEAKAGPIKFSMTSRQDSIMVNLKFRFRYLKRVQSI